MTLMIMVILLSVCLGVSGLTAQNLRRTYRQSRSNLALQAAQAGLELATTQALTAMNSGGGVFDSTTVNLTSALANVSENATVTAWVSPGSTPKFGWITCSANISGFTRSVRSRLRGKNVGIWNNAIFAGTGAAGQAINGNVDIRGSVHLLGEGEEYSDLNSNGHRDGAEPFTDSNSNGVWDPGEPYTDSNNDGVWSAAEPYNDSNNNGVYDPPMTVTEMNSTFSGKAYIGNNYHNMPTALESIVPSLMGPGITVETLDSEVRCKHGKIALSGTASLGTSDLIDGGTSKNTLDGVFVNDGWGGNQGSASVFSDNGTTEAYDLEGYGIKFPLITGIGAETYTAGGSQYDNYTAYYNSKGLSVNVSTIKSTTAAFSFGPDSNGNSLSFTPASGSTPAVLNITGVIRLSGDLQIGAKDSVYYKGSGTMYSPGTIRVDGNFLPKPGETFPTTSKIGLVAQNDLMLATGNGSAQLKMAGAFYAMDTIVSRKQNEIAGTFVSNYFDMGTNVPSIFQVPALASNMPPAMPGDKQVWSVQSLTWRER